jgi:hypothetical protein
VTREPGPGTEEEMMKTAGYGKQSPRESGSHFAEPFWVSGGAPLSVQTGLCCDSRILTCCSPVLTPC